MSIIKSKNKVLDENRKKSVLVCKFDTDSMTVTIFNANTQIEKHSTFHSDYIRYHVHYVSAKYKESLQRYVDNGTIYKYLSDLEARVIETENRQVERWKKYDKEYLAAVERGDKRKANGLLSCLHYMAREIVICYTERAVDKHPKIW